MRYIKQVLCCAMTLGSIVVAQQRPLSLNEIEKEFDAAESAIQTAINSVHDKELYQNAIKYGLKNAYGYGFELFAEYLELTVAQKDLFHLAYDKALLALTDYDVYFVNNPDVKVPKDFVAKLKNVLGIRRLVEDLKRYEFHARRFNPKNPKITDWESPLTFVDAAAWFKFPDDVRFEKWLGSYVGEPRSLEAQLVYMVQNKKKYGKMLSDYLQYLDPRFNIWYSEYSHVIFVGEIRRIVKLDQAINSFKEQSNYQDLEKALVDVSNYFNIPGTIEYNFFRTVCATGLEKGIFGVITGYFLGSDIAKERIDIFKDSTFKQENNKVIQVLVDTCYEALALYFSAVKDITTIPSEIYNLITFLNSLDKSCAFKSKNRAKLTDVLSKTRVGLAPNKKDGAIAPMIHELIK